MKYSTFSAFEDEFYDMQIRRKDIKTKLSLGHYDGPASGIIEYNDKLYLAKSMLNHDHHPRIFLVIDIGSYNIDLLLAWSEKRYELFGNMKWNDNGTRDDTFKVDHMTKEFEEKAKLFRAHNKMPDCYPDYGDEVIGWFEGWRLYS